MKHTTIALALCASAPLAFGDNAELAKALSNPVADLISFPIQNNIDFGIGPGDGTQWKTNVQPVIPFDISEHWNLISRTVLPVIEQNGIALNGDSNAFGLGDTTQSLFFSPKDPDPFIWGIGPAFLIPTATDSLLGNNLWGAGPTGVILKQKDGWTYGALVNHLWDFAGSGDGSVNATYLQPFLSYTTHKATSLTLNLESTYDWDNDQWTVPMNLMLAQIIKVGGHPVQLFVGGRYYLEAASGGPDWGLRFGLTMLFPKS